MTDNPRSIGVVIGRFETPYLHDGHRRIIDIANSENTWLCIVLGTNGGVATTRYPLDVATRTLMLQRHYPKATILSIKDLGNKDLWSVALDKMLTERFKGYCSHRCINLYGSRDSFAQNYNGIFNQVEVEEIPSVSATEIRIKECTTPKESSMFRQGVIYATLTRYAIAFSATDIIPYRYTWDGIEVLMGMRNAEGGRSRYIGGIVDPADSSHEEGALRELKEEAGEFEVGPLQYLCSMKISTPYYDNTRDALFTSAFLTRYKSGTPIAGDDLDHVHWMPLEYVLSNCVPAHVGLSERVLYHFRHRNNLLLRFALTLYYSVFK